MAVTTYITNAQAEDLFAQVASRLGASTVVDDGSVTDAIEIVSGRISGILNEIGISPGSIAGDDDAAAHIRGIAGHGVCAEMLRRFTGGGFNARSELETGQQEIFESELRELRKRETNIGALTNFREDSPPIPTTVQSGGTYATRPVDNDFKF